MTELLSSICFLFCPFPAVCQGLYFVFSAGSVASYLTAVTTSSCIYGPSTITGNEYGGDGTSSERTDRTTGISCALTYDFPQGRKPPCLHHHHSFFPPLFAGWSSEIGTLLLIGPRMMTRCPYSRIGVRMKAYRSSPVSCTS